jgi:hypothetical protein
MPLEGAHSKLNTGTQKTLLDTLTQKVVASDRLPSIVDSILLRKLRINEASSLSPMTRGIANIEL